MKSFSFLGRTLPNDTFLVTNRVSWYDFFEREYKWRHAKWEEVVHSGVGRSWGGRDQEVALTNKNAVFDLPKIVVDETTQKMQMWSDWYTMLTAETVYHTHSDFSISAIHWQDLPSKSFKGWDETKKELIFEEESWRKDGETAALVDRRRDVEGKSQLKLCK